MTEVSSRVLVNPANAKEKRALLAGNMASRSLCTATRCLKKNQTQARLHVAVGNLKKGCRLLRFHLSAVATFWAMSLVGIYPDRASLLLSCMDIVKIQNIGGYFSGALVESNVSCSKKTCFRFFKENLN